MPGSKSTRPSNVKGKGPASPHSKAPASPSKPSAVPKSSLPCDCGYPNCPDNNPRKNRIVDPDRTRDKPSAPKTKDIRADPAAARTRLPKDPKDDHKGHPPGHYMKVTPHTTFKAVPKRPVSPNPATRGSPPPTARSRPSHTNGERYSAAAYRPRSPEPDEARRRRHEEAKRQREGERRRAHFNDNPVTARHAPPRAPSPPPAPKIPRLKTPDNLVPMPNAYPNHIPTVPWTPTQMATASPDSPVARRTPHFPSWTLSQDGWGRWPAQQESNAPQPAWVIESVYAPQGTADRDIRVTRAEVYQTHMKRYEEYWRVDEHSGSKTSKPKEHKSRK